MCDVVLERSAVLCHAECIYSFKLLFVFILVCIGDGSWFFLSIVFVYVCKFSRFHSLRRKCRKTQEKQTASWSLNIRKK